MHINITNRGVNDCKSNLCLSTFDIRLLRRRENGREIVQWRRVPARYGRQRKRKGRGILVRRRRGYDVGREQEIRKKGETCSPKLVL